MKFEEWSMTLTYYSEDIPPYSKLEVQFFFYINNQFLEGEIANEGLFIFTA